MSVDIGSLIVSTPGIRNERPRIVFERVGVRRLPEGLKDLLGFSSFVVMAPGHESLDQTFQPLWCQ